MDGLLFILASLALLAAFLLLTSYETSHGVRYFAEYRTRLDKEISRLIFIWENVDLVEFAEDEIKHFLKRVAHDAIKYTLQMVRAVERGLSRLVRYFRVHEAHLEAPRETAREFVKTLSEFKDTINAEHPEIKDGESERDVRS